MVRLFPANVNEDCGQAAGIFAALVWLVANVLAIVPVPVKLGSCRRIQKKPCVF